MVTGAVRQLDECQAPRSHLHIKGVALTMEILFLSVHNIQPQRCPPTAGRMSSEGGCPASASSTASSDTCRMVIASWRIPETYIRGNTIKYLRVPDEVLYHHHHHYPAISCHMSASTLSLCPLASQAT